MLKDSLSPDGMVVEDTRTNSLIITDVPGQFQIIDSTIAKLDVPVPQILIEVEMIEVAKQTGGPAGDYVWRDSVDFYGRIKGTNLPFGIGRVAPSSSSGSGSSSSSSSSSSSGSSTNDQLPRDRGMPLA